MATAKQLAARRLFAQRAKAGTLKRRKRRKNPTDRDAQQQFANPRKRRAPRGPSRKGLKAPSQITKRAPTKRLVRRRKVTKSAQARGMRGFFANPSPAMPFEVFANGKCIARFPTKNSAIQYARAYHTMHPAQTVKVLVR